MSTPVLWRHSAALALPAAGGTLATLLAVTFPAPVAAAALAGPAALAALVVWPWAALPVAIVGGALAAQVLGLEGVAAVTAAHIGLAGAGFLAVGLRRVLDPAWGVRVATPADRPMILFGALVALGSAYGLAVGHAPDRVLLAAYELGVVPAYFFLATVTLTSPRRLGYASVLFAAAALVTLLVELPLEGRHGGLFSALALLPALLAAARVTDPLRFRLLIASSTLFALDVALSGYRAIWLATGLALLVLAASRVPRLLRVSALAFTLAALVGMGVALAHPDTAAERAGVVGSSLGQSAGHRLPEAQVGWDAFLSNPLLGAGMGQVEPDVFITGFGVTDVGPVYHVFYVMLLANVGLVGLALLLWLLASAVRGVPASGEGLVLAFRALLVGFVAAAVFAGPTDGHWELGLLAALTLLAARFERFGRVG
jgi:hypothetical protein